MKIQVSKLDKLFSYYIRLRAGWACEYCGKKFGGPSQGLHCSHFHGRRKRSVRWDPDNAISACFGCHRILTENPNTHIRFFKKRMGSQPFQALDIKANMPTKPDYKMIELWLKQKIKEIENEDNRTSAENQ